MHRCSTLGLRSASGDERRKADNVLQKLEQQEARGGGRVGEKKDGEDAGSDGDAEVCVLANATTKAYLMLNRFLPLCGHVCAGG